MHSQHRRTKLAWMPALFFCNWKYYSCNWKFIKPGEFQCRTYTYINFESFIQSSQIQV